MCGTCGCGQEHGHAHAPGRVITLEQDILAANDLQAALNRRRLSAAGVFALNLISSPGSGKTTLLVETLGRLKGRRPLAVLVGDQATSLDADRLAATGIEAVQINTGKGCHLDARSIDARLGALSLGRGGILFIENVGNLVCPAAFDLGEAKRVVLLSVTEGEDKPLKYPDAFRGADLALLTKVDLLPHLSFDLERCLGFVRQINPRIEVLKVSARSGEGMGEWVSWLERHARPTE